MVYHISKKCHYNCVDKTNIIVMLDIIMLHNAIMYEFSLNLLPIDLKMAQICYWNVKIV